MGEITLRATEQQIFRTNMIGAPLLTSFSNDSISIANMDTPSINEMGAVVTGNRLDLPAGKYKIHIALNSQSTNTRTSHAIELSVNGSVYSVAEPSDYKRVNESHTEASTVLDDVFVLNSAGYIEYGFVQRSGNAGGLTSALGTSRVTLTKL